MDFRSSVRAADWIGSVVSVEVSVAVNDDDRPTASAERFALFSIIKNISLQFNTIFKQVQQPRPPAAVDH